VIAIRPAALLLVLPGRVRQEGHLGGIEAEAQHVVQVEVLQLVRADGAFGALLGLAVGRAGHQFGLISVPRISSSTCASLRPITPDSATQRTRCEISVFGTLALTL
jgi:hypothetical protein